MEAINTIKTCPVSALEPELSRSYFQLANICQKGGLNEEAEQALSEALRIRATLLPDEDREGLPPLQESDFDALVPFWSR